MATGNKLVGNGGNTSNRPIGRAVVRQSPRVVEPAATSSKTNDDGRMTESWKDRLAVELTAPDRLGLLHDVAASLSNTGWNVVGADVWTNSGRAACILHIAEDERRIREQQDRIEEEGEGEGDGEGRTREGEQKREGNATAEASHLRVPAGGAALGGFAAGGFTGGAGSAGADSFWVGSAGSATSGVGVSGSPPIIMAVEGSAMKKVRSRNSLLADGLQANQQLPPVASPTGNAHSSSSSITTTTSSGGNGSGSGGKAAVAGAQKGARRNARARMGDAERLRSLVSAAAGKGANVRVCSIGEGAPAGGTETERRLHKLLTVEKKAGNAGQANGVGGEGGSRTGGNRGAGEGRDGKEGSGPGSRGVGHTGMDASMSASSATADVSVHNSAEMRYTIVCIRCADRPKLLFDALCVITDMSYVIHHASVESGEGLASQVGVACSPSLHFKLCMMSAALFLNGDAVCAALP